MNDSTLNERLHKAIDAVAKRATIHDEAGVKRVVRRVLDKADIASFMPPANAYGRSGISDIIAIKHGRVVFIETKYGYNKPTAMQLKFGAEVKAAGAPFVVINERNLVDRMVLIIMYMDDHPVDLLHEDYT